MAVLGLLLAVAIGLPAALLRDQILGVFIHDPETLALARGPLLISALMIWIDALGMVLFNAHMGAGDTRRVMLVSVGYQWCFFLPVAYVAGPILGHGLLVVWILQGVYRLLQTLTIMHFWRRGDWAAVRV